MTSTLTREDLTVAVQWHLAAQSELLAAEETRARIALRATDARAALLAELEARNLSLVVVSGHLVEVTEAHGVRGVTVTPIQVLP